MISDFSKAWRSRSAVRLFNCACNASTSTAGAGGDSTDEVSCSSDGAASYGEAGASAGTRKTYPRSSACEVERLSKNDTQSFSRFGNKNFCRFCDWPLLPESVFYSAPPSEAPINQRYLPSLFAAWAPTAFKIARQSPGLERQCSRAAPASFAVAALCRAVSGSVFALAARCSAEVRTSCCAGAPDKPRLPLFTAKYTSAITNRHFRRKPTIRSVPSLNAGASASYRHRFAAVRAPARALPLFPFATMNPGPSRMSRLGNELQTMTGNHAQQRNWKADLRTALSSHLTPI